MTNKSEKAQIESEYEQLKAKARTALGQSFKFLDELPEGPPKKPIPFPYGYPKPRPYGWYSK